MLKLSSNSHSHRYSRRATATIAKKNAVTQNHTIVKPMDAQEIAAVTFAALLSIPF